MGKHLIIVVKHKDREMSETELSPTIDSESDDALTASTNGSERPITTDNETETEKKKYIWHTLVWISNALKKKLTPVLSLSFKRK